MFFPRLRRQAKWMFVFLALVFGVGFVVFGVGGNLSGTGLGDVLSNIGQAGGPDVGNAREKVEDNPRDPAALLGLADALTQNNRTDESIPVIERYLELRPKDADQISRLAGLYMARGARHPHEALAAQAEAAAAAPGSAFAPASGLVNQVRSQGEISKALSSQANERLSEASGEASVAYQAARDLWKKLAGLQPNDSSVQFSLAGSAEQAGDYATAIAAYKRFIKLAPDDPNVPAIRRQIELLKSQQQLQAAAPQPGG
jgi:tetratricopeptide (TPR) repeat protein